MRTSLIYCLHKTYMAHTHTQSNVAHLSPTHVSCSISVMTSAISNFNRCEVERTEIHSRDLEEGSIVQSQIHKWAYKYSFCIFKSYLSPSRTHWMLIGCSPRCRPAAPSSCVGCWTARLSPRQTDPPALE